MEDTVLEQEQLSSHTLIISQQMNRNIIILYTIFPTHHRVILIVLIIIQIPHFSDSAQTNIPKHNLVNFQTQLPMKVQSTMKIIIINKMKLMSNISTNMVRISCMIYTKIYFIKITKINDLITSVAMFLIF